jgi:hypothetical protein
MSVNGTTGTIDDRLSYVTAPSPKHTRPSELCVVRLFDFCLFLLLSFQAVKANMSLGQVFNNMSYEDDAESMVTTRSAPPLNRTDHIQTLLRIKPSASDADEVCSMCCS